MKISNKISTALAAAALLLSVSGCAVDNMDAPDCHITGRLISGDHQVGVRQASGNQLGGSFVKMELWQAGYGKETAQEINVAQDGTFAVDVYAGKVRIIAKAGVGPWSKADTLRLDVKKNVDITYPVNAYAVVTEPVIDYDKATGDFSATYEVILQNSEAAIVQTGIVINDTRFVDTNNQKLQINAQQKTAGVITVTGNLADLDSKRYLFARAFVKTDKSSYEAYSLQPKQLR